VFAQKASDVISYLQSEKNEGPVNIVLPFKDKTKTELLKMYLEQGGDINKAYNETISCYNPVNGSSCMSCSSCMSKFVAFYNNGYKFNNEEIKKFINYVENNYETQKADVIKLYNELK
jgi:7-cyano-7-deazaguanine synthase in queuosine biosynthesis